MHNDISFLLAGDINLYEQQSTVSPNIPLRMLEYLGNLYERYIQENELNKYGRTLIRLPVPRLIVFYNGSDSLPEEATLRLSDSFTDISDADVEVRVHMLNINAGKNKRLKEACEPLLEYCWLVDAIRERRKVLNLSDAIDASLREMPDSFTIKPFLIAHQAEVTGMLETEYDEKKTMELFRKEGWTEGHTEGRQEGLAEGIRNTIAAYREFHLSDDEIIRRIMEKYTLSEEAAREYISETAKL